MLCKGTGHWRRVAFNDESQFCLNGPTGLSAYWRDKRQALRCRVRGQRGGGVVMVWGFFLEEKIGARVHRWRY